MVRCKAHFSSARGLNVIRNLAFLGLRIRVCVVVFACS